MRTAALNERRRFYFDAPRLSRRPPKRFDHIRSRLICAQHRCSLYYRRMLARHASTRQSVIHHSAPRGFTTIETMVALSLIIIAFLTVAGATPHAVRSLADSQRERTAALLVARRHEITRSSTCLTSNGTDSINAVVVTWNVEVASHEAVIDQRAQYPTAGGPHTESYRSIVPCR